MCARNEVQSFGYIEQECQGIARGSWQLEGRIVHLEVIAFLLLGSACGSQHGGHLLPRLKHDVEVSLTHEENMTIAKSGGK